MIRLFLFIVITVSFLQSETFEERQIILKDIKNIIQYEESLARTYEQYILDNYKLPTITEINPLVGGNLQSFVESTTASKITNTTLSSDLTKLSYALGDTLKTELSIKNVYDSSIFRKRTYVRDDAVYFMLEDKFAKHLFDLIQQKGAINTCPNSVFTTPINCKEDNNHIYIQLTKKLNEGKIVPDTYLMAYHIDKFETGPFVITNDTSKHDEDIFKSIPKGILIYDTDGTKYIKTTSRIEILK